MAVAPFQAVSPKIAPEVTETLMSLVATQLSNSPFFSVVERRRMNAIVKEQRLSLSGLVSNNTLVKVGRLAGAEWIVTGTVTEFPFIRDKNGQLVPENNSTNLLTIFVPRGKMRVNFTCIKVSTALTNSFTINSKPGGTVLGGNDGKNNSGLGKIKIGDDAYALIADTAEKAMNELERRVGAVTVRVAEAGPKRAYIDIGADKGARKGYLYAVYSEGRPIRGANGRFLGMRKVYYGLLKITDVQDGYSVCAYAKGGPSVIRPGDLLEPIDRERLKEIEFEETRSSFEAPPKYVVDEPDPEPAPKPRRKKPRR